MVAALNPYRQIVAGQRLPAKTQTTTRTASLKQAQQAQAMVPAPAAAPAVGGEPGAQRVLAQARAQAQKVQVKPISKFAANADERGYDETGTFNPQAYGGTEWRDGLQRAIPDPRNRIFDKKGTLNASDNKDALKQIAYLLQSAVKDSRQARFTRQGSQMQAEERRQILAAAVQDPEGFAILGQELLLPIKDLVDYEGWARKIYRVRPLAQGEFFRLAKDVRSTAWVIGQDGQGIEARLFGRFVTPSEFKIGSRNGPAQA